MPPVERVPPSAAAPEVPGYAPRARLGTGPCGEVWSARCLTTGAAVALRVLPPGVGATAATAAVLRERVRRLAALADSRVAGAAVAAHLVHVRDAVHLPAGRGWVLVADLAAGGDLERLVAAGPLDHGQLRTLGVPLLRALAELHAAGLVHGGLAPGNVLLSADGRPLLGDLGVAELAGVPPRPSLDPRRRGSTVARPADDRHALAALLCYAGSGVAGPEGLARLPGAVGAVLRPVLEGADRWPGAELRAALERVPARPLAPRPLPASTGAAAQPDVGPAPEPLAVPPAVPPAREPVADEGLAALVDRIRIAAPARRRPSRAVVVAVLASAAAAGTGAAAAVTRAGAPHAGPAAAGVPAGAAPPTATPPAAATPTAPTAAGTAGATVDWAAVLRGLDARRADALTRLDAAALAQVETGPALAQDGAALRLLRARGLAPRGLRERLDAVRPAWASAGEAVLAVDSTRAAYALVPTAPGGAVPGRAVPGRAVPVAASPRRAWLVRLVRGAGRWQVAEVEAASG